MITDKTTVRTFRLEGDKGTLYEHVMDLSNDCVHCIAADDKVSKSLLVYNSVCQVFDGDGKHIANISLIGDLIPRKPATWVCEFIDKTHPTISLTSRSAEIILDLEVMVSKYWLSLNKPIGETK